jgi:hypothetical protein
VVQEAADLAARVVVDHRSSTVASPSRFGMSTSTRLEPGAGELALTGAATRLVRTKEIPC